MADLLVSILIVSLEHPRLEHCCVRASVGRAVTVEDAWAAERQLLRPEPPVLGRVI